ncbi:MAG: RNA polymerase sigma factor [Gemmataceae bacterium]
MSDDSLEERLSGVSTMWTILQQAHNGSADQVNAARALLLERYRKPVLRYLKRVVGDQSIAEDLAQEFSLCLINGEFHKADPERGKFRYYVKGVLFNIVSNHRKKQVRSPQPLAPDNPAWDALEAEATQAGPEFDESWSAELLNRVWKTFRQVHPTFETILRCRADNPRMASGDMAEVLSQKLGKPVSASMVRQNLRRARHMFAELLLVEVAHSLETPTKEILTEELSELRLLEYCRPALENMKCEELN